MATTASILVDTVLQRVRDPQGTTHPRAFVLTIIGHAQRVVNAAHGIVLNSTTLTTNPRRVFYSMTQDVPNALKIVGVHEDGRSLDLVPWKDYWYTVKGWSRTVGPGEKFRAYSLIGRDILVIWPAKDRTSSVEIVHATAFPDFAGEGDLMSLPDEDLPTVVDMTEFLLLVKGRNFPPIDPAVESVKKRLRAMVT